MQGRFESKGGIMIPKGISLSGSLWVQCAVDVFEGGRIERDEKIGLVNVGGRKVAEYVGPAKSFMRNWAIALTRSLFYAASDTPEQYTDSTGVDRFHALYEGLGGSGQGVTAAAADFAFGDSNAAVDATQFNMQGLILGPSGPVITTVIQEDAVARIFKVEGTVLNSGALFNVQEVGLFAHLREGNVGSQNHRSMFMRDIVNPLVAVANGQTALGRYTFTAAI